MDGLDFSQKFVDWVMQDVTTVSYSFLINTELTKYFEAAKALRKGYFMSPFLFSMVMKCLSRNLNELKHQK